MDYENIIYQLKIGKEQAVKQGSVMVVRPPYGYRTVKVRGEDGKLRTLLDVVEEEARIVRLIFVWYVYGDEEGQPLSISAIAKKLTDMRVPTRWDTSLTKRGEVGLKKRKFPPGVWDESVIYTMLCAETYVGRWAYGKTKSVPIPGSDKMKQIPVPRDEWLWIDVPAIIEEEVFQSAQERMKHNATMAKRNRKFDYLFAGMLSCNMCKKAYCGIDGTKSLPRYRCSSRRARYTSTACDMPNFGEDEIDAVVWPWIQAIVSNPDKVDETLNERQHEAEEKNAPIRALITATERLIQEKREERARLLRLYSKKADLDEQLEALWLAEDSRLQQEIAGHEATHAKLTGQLIKPNYTPEYLRDVKAACARIATGLTHFTRTEKREAYDLLNLTATLAIEESVKVVYAACVLDAKKLLIQSGIAFSSPPSCPATMISRSATGIAGIAPAATTAALGKPRSTAMPLR